MTAIHLAGPQDAARLLPLMAAFHEEENLHTTPEHREAALMPLLHGSPHGQAFLIGPRIAPIGYVVLTLGWSIEFGGKDAFVDELYLRASVRGRGLGTEVLTAAARYLAGQEVKALHLEVDHENANAIAVYRKLGFGARPQYGLMSLRLE